VPSVTEPIDVAVPIRTAYNQWTQFESFPYFMGGVESIAQNDDTHSHWVTKIGGVTREFDTEITEHHPDGTSHAGVVTFHRLAEGEAKVTVQLDWQSEGIVDSPST
jgi:uncharacterized membrane protein